jgi:uncharacterized phage-associated protein
MHLEDRSISKEILLVFLSISGTIEITMSIRRKNYENAILYLCQRLEGGVRGKKKLAKLLYFADFDLYEKIQKSITGDVYRAFPMGPVPSALEDVTAEMIRKKMLSLERIEERAGYNPTEIYTCLSEPDLSVFDDEEKRMLDRIVVKYGHLTGKQLEELSHAEAPYIGTELRENIPYELAFYRGTDFGDV